MKMRASSSIAIVIILLISCSFVSTPLVPSSPSPTITFSQPIPAEPSATLEPSLTPAPTFTDTVPPLPTCEGNFTGIHITMPNNAWTCRVEQNTNNGSIYDEPIYLQSPLFTIFISTLGRGPFCGDAGDDPNGTCEVTEFYKNQYFWFATYTLEGEIREIWGVLDRTARVNELATFLSISISYQGMETRELTPDEKQELIQLLDSITFTK